MGTETLYQMGTQSPQKQGSQGPKFEVQWEAIGKRSSDRVEILYGDYPEPKKHACEISAQLPQKWESQGHKIWGSATAFSIMPKVLATGYYYY